MPPEIAGRPVGAGASVFSVAEIGLNHGGRLETALALVDAAAWAGASAVKLQTIEASALVADSCPPPAHVRAASLRHFFSTFELSASDHLAIVERARARGLAVLATPFAEALVPMLDTIGVDALKIASGDLTCDGLVAAAARTGRPLIISTGMSALEEVKHSVEVARRAGADQIVVLHCVSSYPTPAESENLLAIQTLARALDVPVGLSDHGTGSVVSAVAAVALGACMYERHLMLPGGDGSVDAAVSSTPDEFTAIVAAMARARIALGDGRKRCMPAEERNLTASRRGLYARRPLRAGARLTADDVLALRPATAVTPSDLPRLLASPLRRDVPAGAPFCAADLRAERAS
jgi:sialic acid synthase SpsE